MNKLILVIALFIGGYFFFNKCAATQAKNVAFSGTWNITSDNTLMGRNDSARVDVVTDGKRFRLTRRSSDEYGSSTSVQVYDGEMLHTKSEYQPSALSRMHEPEPPKTVRMDSGPDTEEDEEDGMRSSSTEPETDSRKIDETELATLRFWNTSHQASEKSGPGGRIAGRETNLYQARWRRLDGDMTGQAWLDAETGILLKRIASMYSRQVEQTVMKMSEECEKIEYNAVDASAFSKP